MIVRLCMCACKVWLRRPALLPAAKRNHNQSIPDIEK